MNPAVRKMVSKEWLCGRDTPAIARGLLGKFLVHRTPEGEVAGMITEVEAYQGQEDLACHARHGRTPRNSVLFGEGAHWYVYLCYGIHELLNVVTGPRDYPAAVLIRGLEGMIGPGRLTRRFGIGRQYQGMPCSVESGLWLEDRGVVLDQGSVVAGPRIGVDYAGDHWAAMPWRFHVPPQPARQVKKPGKPR